MRKCVIYNTFETSECLSSRAWRSKPSCPPAASRQISYFVLPCPSFEILLNTPLDRCGIVIIYILSLSLSLRASYIPVHVYQTFHNPIKHNKYGHVSDNCVRPAVRYVYTTNISAPCGTSIFQVRYEKTVIGHVCRICPYVYERAHDEFSRNRDHYRTPTNRFPYGFRTDFVITDVQDNRRFAI